MALGDHYRRLDTGELLEIARKDLTAEARQVLNAVLEQRGAATAAGPEAGIRPRPAASGTEPEFAPRWARMVAFSVDLAGAIIIPLVLLLPLGFVSENLYVYGYLLSCNGYLLLRDALPKQSLGKRLMKLRVVQAGSGVRCTGKQSLLRNLPQLLFLIDAAFILGERRMRLGDHLAGTRVVCRSHQ